MAQKRRSLLPVFSLRGAVAIFVVLPCLLAMAVVGLAGLRGLEERVNARMQEDLELIARTLRLPLSDALGRDRPGLLQAVIDSTVGFDQVYAVHVYDEDGSRVASSGRRRAAVPTREAAELAEQGERQEAEADVGDDTLVSVFQPLTTEGGRIAGLLQVTRDRGAVAEYLDRSRRLAVASLALAGLLLAALIALGHHFAVGRHLRRIELSLQRVRDGDTRHRLAPAGVAEFRELAHGVNGMLDGIAASQAALGRQRDKEAALRERLHQSEKMAAIGRLAAGVAHELGSPLATLYGRTEQMLRDAPQGSAQHDALQAVQAALARMEQTIRQLLDYGRANPLQRRPVLVEPLLRRLADASARAEVVTIESPAPGLRVDADPLRLEQAVGNLLANALHAARSRVSLGAECHEGRVRIHVGDDGPGIPQELRERVFEPFFTTKPIGEGTGLGLSVAAAAAADHGGRLDLARDPMGGARFILDLPQEAQDGQD